MRESSDIRVAMALAVVMLLTMATAFAEVQAATSSDHPSGSARAASYQQVDQGSATLQDRNRTSAEFEN